MSERQVFKTTCRMHGGDIELMVRPEDVEEYQRGSSRHVQDIFDYLTAAEREMFLSGFCGECWVKLFPPLPPLEVGERVWYDDNPGTVQAVNEGGTVVDWDNGERSTVSRSDLLTNAEYEEDE